MRHGFRLFAGVDSMAPKAPLALAVCHIGWTVKSTPAVLFDRRLSTGFTSRMGANIRVVSHA